MSNVINELTNSINDPDFAKQARTDPKRTFRSRILSFPCLVTYLIHHLQSAAQLELDAFFGNLAGITGLFRVVSAGALSHARHWLKHEVFIRLLERLIATCRAGGVFDQPDWRGFRLVAGDGSSIYLPRDQRLFNDFGTYYQDGVLSYVQARALVLLDCASGIFLGATLEDDQFGERDLLVRLLDYLPLHSLLLLDRGYPAWWLFALLLQRGQHFVVRADLHNWPLCKAFLASGEAERIVTFTPSSSEQRAEFMKHDLAIAPVTLRLVRRGADQVVVTSLLDAEAYPADEIAELYSDRWKVETALGILKKPCAVEAFSGRTPLAIRQDFHAAILRAALLAVALLDARALRQAQAELAASKKPAQTAKPVKKPKTVNATHATSALRRLLPSLLFNIPDNLQTILATAESSVTQVIALIAKTTHTPGKPRPRKMKKRSRYAQPKKFAM